MFTISLVGQKGGTGKTTISVGLACAAARAGRTVAILDLDPQATALKWKDRRSEKNPIVVAAQAGRLKPALDTARAGGADYVVIDSAGLSWRRCRPSGASCSWPGLSPSRRSSSSIASTRAPVPVASKAFGTCWRSNTA